MERMLRLYCSNRLSSLIARRPSNLFYSSLRYQHASTPPPVPESSTARSHESSKSTAEAPSKVSQVKIVSASGSQEKSSSWKEKLTNIGFGSFIGILLVSFYFLFYKNTTDTTKRHLFDLMSFGGNSKTDISWNAFKGKVTKDLALNEEKRAEYAEQKLKFDERRKLAEAGRILEVANKDEAIAYKKILETNRTGSSLKSIREAAIENRVRTHQKRAEREKTKAEEKAASESDT